MKPNPIDDLAIFVFLIVVVILPQVLFFEICYWINGRNPLINGAKKGILVGTSFGIITVLLFLVGASGESGLASLIVMPFILFIYIPFGALIGHLYTKRSTLFTKKENEIN